ncbi:MAG: rane protein insertion efficiency factor YidD, partial [Bacteroidota bacterium]
MRWIKYLLIFPIRLYQWTLSPLLGPGKCRYQPTCSHYAVEAIEEWG